MKLIQDIEGFKSFRFFVKAEEISHLKDKKDLNTPSVVHSTTEDCNITHLLDHDGEARLSQSPF